MVKKEYCQKIQEIIIGIYIKKQVEKHKGNVLTDKDYVDKEFKDVNVAIELQKNNNNNNKIIKSI